jgi:hypothetical protein
MILSTTTSSASSATNFAQERAVSGTVSDNARMPLPVRC